MQSKNKVRLIIVSGVLLVILIIVLILSNHAETKETLQNSFETSSHSNSVDRETMYKTDLDTVTEKENPKTDKKGVKKQTETQEEKYPRIKKEKDGREYTAYAKKEKWDSITEEEKAEMTEQLIPVLQDKNKTIDRICTSKSRPELEPYSYVLATFLKTYCQEQEIQAHTGTFLAYAS